MSGLINNIRENTIKISYDAAVLQLKDLVKNHPHQTIFHIDAGCTDEAMTKEIVHRLTAAGIMATYKTSGFFSTTHYIEVVDQLPEKLVH